ncbi:MAG: nucleotide sugar dehydrogenase [Euryarchaeota archaeon]|nr:nucleotide sugar dehydrogenase [Euryarchaeota archaeon]|tara:strand:- start:970 stop:2313 length:1344 start_codon:yes stop_codon:yes gene_type:complete
MHLASNVGHLEQDTTIGIIGLGYVGLPTAIGFHDAGFNVWGVDVSQRTVDMVLKGENPTGDPDVDDIVPAPGVERWHITNSAAEAVPHCDVVLVTVPTPITHDLKPDLSYVAGAGRDVFEAIPKGSNTIVVLESTVYPGVTAQTWMPIIEELGLEIGKDLEIAYCPERFNPGDPAHGVRQVARVIGCSNPDVGAALVALYSKLTSEDVRYVGKLEVAEAAKVIENVQRDINIALVNELARIFPALDVDVEDVLSAAATKWNFHRYTPGVGVGGHCIPVDPYYMIQRAADVGVPAGLITAARAVNRSMPSHVAGVLSDLMWNAGVAAKDAKVLLLGWSYKAEVGDPRETPAEPLAETLMAKGITVGAWDPHLGDGSYPEGVEVISNIADAHGYDMAVLVTAHKACLSLDWAQLAQQMRTPLIYDGRRVLNLDELNNSGWKAYAVGRPV